MKKTNKIKKYAELTKKNPEYFLFDVLNIVFVIFVLGMLFIFFLWIASAFKGDISVNPIALQAGKWGVHWYGIIFAVAFILAFLMVARESTRKKIDGDLIINMVFGSVVLGFLSARLTFAFLNWGYYSQNPIQILNIWQGGLSLYGALLGGLIFIIIYSLIKKISYWKILDIFAPAMLLGQVVGRWGNFFNQELFGYPTKGIFKMYISPFNRPFEYRGSAFFHPVFLYESFLCLIALIILLIIRKNKSIREGGVFLSYLILYSVIRFFIEFVRIEPEIFLSLTLAQLVSIAIFVISLLIIIIKRKITKKQ